MAAVSKSAQYKHSHNNNNNKHVFSDAELSEIFQIDFGQIFGNPDSGRSSNYKGVDIKKSAQGTKCANYKESVIFCFACIIIRATTSFI